MCFPEGHVKPLTFGFPFGQIPRGSNVLRSLSVSPGRTRTPRCRDTSETCGMDGPDVNGGIPRVRGRHPRKLLLTPDGSESLVGVVPLGHHKETVSLEPGPLCRLSL